MRSILAAAAAALLSTVVPYLNAQAVIPPVVMSNHQTLYSALTNGTQRVSANTRGDVFFHDSANHQLLELPSGSTVPVVILKNTNTTTSSSGPSSVDIDADGNLYFNNTYAGRVVKVPFVNGSYATNVDASDATLKANTCTAGATTPCVLTTLGALVGYYAQTSDTAFDAAGNFYFVDVNDSISSGKYNRIVKLAASGTVSILVDSLATASNAQMVSDSAGDLWYTNGVGLYYLAAGASSFTQMNAATLSKPTGVTFDKAGNLIVSDTGNSRIVLIPKEGAALNYSDQYVLAPYYTANSVGIDANGTIFYSGASGGASTISQMNIGTYNAPSLAVNATTGSALVYATFNTTVIFQTIYQKTVGANMIASVNTCVAGTTYTAGKSCAFNVQAKPVRVGPTTALVGVTDPSGNVVGQFTFTITGLGSAVNVDPGTASTISTAFKTPAGVAVDRLGNVFVADTGNNVVYEFAGGSGVPITLGTGLNRPTGVAVNTNGDLFIADTGNNRVVEIPSIAAVLQPTQQTVIASGLTPPIAVGTGLLDALFIAQAGSLDEYAVGRGIAPALTRNLSKAYAKPLALTTDPTGNLYLGDSSGVVEQFILTADTHSDILTGLTSPSGLATDAAGDLFLLDAATAKAVRIPNNNGTLDTANAFSLGKFTSPAALAADYNGNIYLTDTGSTSLLKLSRTLGTLNFGAISQNTTSPSLSAAIVSSGNQSLTLGSPVYTATGDTTVFTPSTTCTAAASLAAGASCNLSATYTPTAKGTNTETLALNASPTVATTPLNLTLTGTGTFLAPTTLSVDIAPAVLTYGQTATLTATLTPSQFNVANATGTVIFYIDGTAQKSIALASNTAVLTTSSLSGGANQIYAVYSGDINYATSIAATKNITIGTASTRTTLQVIAGYTNPVSQTTGSSVTFTATVLSSVTGSLSGTVNFVSGATTLASAQLNGSGVATVVSSTIPAGTYNVAAVYAGNSSYSGSQSTSSPLIISAQGIAFSASSTNITSSPSTPGSVTLSVSSLAGLGTGLATGAPTTFSCSGLPANAVCRFSPAYISLLPSPLYITGTTTLATPVAPTQVGLSIEVGVDPGTPLPPVATLRTTTAVTLAALLAIPMFFFRRRRITALLACILALTASSFFTGCSSGTVAKSVTPTGTYTVIVTATSKSSTSVATSNPSITLNLTVQN